MHAPTHLVPHLRAQNIHSLAEALTPTPTCAPTRPLSTALTRPTAGSGCSSRHCVTWPPVRRSTCHTAPTTGTELGTQQQQHHPSSSRASSHSRPATSSPATQQQQAMLSCCCHLPSRRVLTGQGSDTSSASSSRSSRGSVSRCSAGQPSSSARQKRGCERSTSLSTGVTESSARLGQLLLLPLWALEQ